MVCLHAGEYGMEVSPLPALQYKGLCKSWLNFPRCKRLAYVTLYNPSNGKSTSKKQYIDWTIRNGRQDLQALAAHINSKIESLLSSRIGQDDQTPKVASPPM